MRNLTENKTCGDCFDRVGLVCVVHIYSVRYTTAACSEFRSVPSPLSRPVEHKTDTSMESKVV